MNDSGEGALSRSGGILAANVTNFLFDDLDYNGSLIHNTTEGNETVKAKASHYDFYREEQIIVLVCLIISIVVGNVVVLFAIGLSKRGKRSRMNFFIMQLAIADLSVACFSVTTDLAWKITVQFYAGNAVCKIVKFLQCIAMFASTYVLVALSLDRLHAIARPLSFSKSGLRAKILVGIAWGLSVAFSLPMLIIAEKKVFPNGVQQCYIDFRPWQWKLYVVTLALIVFIIPAIIIALCYAWILFIICTHAKLLSVDSKKSPKRFTATKGRSASNDGNRVTKSKVNDSKSSSRGVIPQAKIRTVKMTLIIVIVFILCWSPYFIFNLLQVYGAIPSGGHMQPITIFIQSLGPLNSVANPIIYGIFSTRICANLRRFPGMSWLLKHLCCCCGDSIRYPERTPSMYSTTAGTGYTSVITGHSVRAPSRVNWRTSDATQGKARATEKGTEILMTNLTEDSSAQCRQYHSAAV